MIQSVEIIKKQLCSILVHEGLYYEMIALVVV